MQTLLPTPTPAPTPTPTPRQRRHGARLGGSDGPGVVYEPSPPGSGGPVDDRRDRRVLDLIGPA